VLEIVKRETLKRIVCSCEIQLEGLGRKGFSELEIGGEGFVSFFSTLV
jgi:hypothetical protein